MKPICQGAKGAAIEDMHERLQALGYDIAESERKEQLFGKTTAQAIAHFRAEHNLELSEDMDTDCWSALVDETYTFGERTLYLREPNFHGSDVRDLQTRLNILGFSCGDADGYYGVHTEAAVKQFQENVGLCADGMAFYDTFDALMRLKHVWSGSSAQGPHPSSGMGYARAAHVLERTTLALSAEDQITRNIAGRLINLASATTPQSKLLLCDETGCPANIPTIILSCHEQSHTDAVTVVIDDFDTLGARLKTVFNAQSTKYPKIRLQLPCNEDKSCSFTVSDAQTFAVMLLDGICTAFDA